MTDPSPDWASTHDALEQQTPVSPDGDDPVLTPQGDDAVIGEANEADVLEQSLPVPGEDDDYPPES